MKELYLHIGQHKTGSTALQAFLTWNRELLCERGIYYPLLDSKECAVENIATCGNARSMASLFLKSSDLFSDSDWAYIRKLQEIFASHERVLLSCEDLWTSSLPDVILNLKNQFELHDDCIKVIAYIRRQDESIESKWKQGVKDSFYAYQMTCWEYTTQIAFQSESVHDLYSMLHNVSSVIGRDNMVVRIYDTERFASSGDELFKDFLSIFGISDISAFRIPAQKINISLNENMTEMKRIFNGIPQSVMMHQEDIKATAFVMAENTKTAEPPFLTDERKKEILDFYEEDNKKIGSEFFGIEGSPFPPLHETTKNEEKTCGGEYSQLHDMVGYLGYILVNQAKEIERLHYLVDEFELSKEIPEGSRVLAYGADRKGRIVYHWLKRKKKYNVVGIVDMRPWALKSVEPDIQAAEKVFELEYDYILIGVSSQETADQIQEWLEMRKIETNKIVRVI